MSFRILLRPEAEIEIVEAAALYENQRGGLGAEFVEAFSQALDDLSLNLLLTSRRHRLRNIRWSRPERFPYRIIYEVGTDSVLIIAVLHSARADRHWRERLES